MKSMKIKVLKGSLKDREFTVSADDVDENGGAIICGRAYSAYLPKDCYKVIELIYEEN